MNELIGKNITTISGNMYYVILYENDFPGFLEDQKLGNKFASLL